MAGSVVCILWLRLKIEMPRLHVLPGDPSRCHVSHWLRRLLCSRRVRVRYLCSLACFAKGTMNYLRPLACLASYREQQQELQRAEERRREEQARLFQGPGLGGGSALEPKPRDSFPPLVDGEPIYQKNEGGLLAVLWHPFGKGMWRILSPACLPGMPCTFCWTCLS